MMQAHRAHASAARAAAGRRAKTITGPVPADMNGTRSTPEASARPVCSGGKKHNASRAIAGHRIPIGMRNSVCHVLEVNCQ